jgi:hypothetical protein
LYNEIKNASKSSSERLKIEKKLQNKDKEIIDVEKNSLKKISF